MDSYIPSEILLRIFSLTEASALPNICLASRRCRNLAQPILFRCFQGEGERLNRFLLAIASQPLLALAVRHLDVGDWGASYAESIEEPHDPLGDRDDISLLENVVRNSSSPKEFKDRAMLAISKGSVDVAVALLFLLCINVESVNFSSTPYLVEESLLMDVARLSTGSTTRSNRGRSMAVRDLNWSQPKGPFQQLRTLHVSHWDSEGSTDLDELCPILRAPLLNSIDGSMLSFRLSDADHTFPSLKSVNIDMAKVSDSSVAELLSSSPALQKLSLRWGREPDLVDELEWDRIGDGLRKHGKRLRYLRLDSSNIEEEEDDDDIPILPMGNLQSLDMLEVLIVPEVALVGYDTNVAGNDSNSDFDTPTLVGILPRSLTNLTLLPSSRSNPDALTLGLASLTMDTRFGKFDSLNLAHKGGDTDYDPLDTLGWMFCWRRDLPSQEDEMESLRRNH